MSFWGTHRKPITTTVWCVFLFIVAWFAYLRGVGLRADEHSAEIAALNAKDRLGKFYLQLAEGEAGARHPLLAAEMANCTRVKTEFDRQLTDLMNRVRFPFAADFKWSEVHTNPKEVLPVGMRPGVYRNLQYPRVRQNVEMYLPKDGSRITVTRENWLGFVPGSAPESVTAINAQEDLRRLAIAEKVSRLAIDNHIGAVIKVTPEAVVREPAYFTVQVQGKDVRKPYSNRFVVNYPVKIQMTGSVEAVMRFFHSLRGEKHFLVIRSFRILGMSALDSGELKLTTNRNADDVSVEISAACMDFDDQSVRSADSKQPGLPPEHSDYQIPTTPRGY